MFTRQIKLLDGSYAPEVIRLGDKIELSLPSAAFAGYEWYHDCNDESVCSITQMTNHGSSSISNLEATIGDFPNDKFLIESKSVGFVIINFEQRRTWLYDVYAKATIAILVERS